MNNIKAIDSANLKAGMYVLCTQKNGNQFIGKISKIVEDNIHFEYTLRDDGTTSGMCVGKLKDFEFADCTNLGITIDLVKLFSDSDKIDPITNKTVADKSTVEDSDFNKVRFNYDEWIEKLYRLITRDNRKVRFVAADVKGNYPLLMLVEEGNSELPVCYTKHGYAGLPEDKDFNSIGFTGLDLFMLVEKSKPVVQYARVYRRDNTGTTFMSQLVNDPKEFDSIDIPTGCSVVKIIPVEL